MGLVLFAAVLLLVIGLAAWSPWLMAAAVVLAFAALLADVEPDPQERDLR